MNTLFKPEHEPPEPDGPADAAYAIVETAAGMVPGGAALLRYIVTPPMERRLEEWMGEVGEALRELKAQRGTNLDELQSNPLFIDAVLAATQSALRTSQTEKLGALRNAVLNSAISQQAVTDQQVFLGLLDRLSAAHLAILRLFSSPQKWRKSDGSHLQNRHTGLAINVLEEAFPDLVGRRDLSHLIWTDLYSAGLVKLGSLQNAGEGPSVMAKRTTSMGDALIAFISDPLSLK